MMLQGCLGCWGLSYNRIYSVLSLFMDLEVRVSDRDMHKGHAVSSGCSSVNANKWLNYLVWEGGCLHWKT